MGRFDQLRQGITFAAQLYGTKAKFNLHGYLRRDPLCLTNLRPGHLDPYPLYDQIRRQGPLSRSSFGVWTSADYEVVKALFRSRKTSSAPADAVQDADLSFVQMDPPDHTRLRRFALPSFSPKTITAFDARIQAIADRLLDQLPADRPFDLVRDFAAPLPIAVITDLLGIPDADADEFARFGAVFGSALGGVSSMRHAKALFEARKALAVIFERTFELKRREPGDDLLTRAAQAGPEMIRPEEMVPLSTLLLIAGFETTVNLIGNGILALLNHPDQWRLLVADPGLAPRAVEEALRYDPPVQRTARTVTEEITIADRQLNTGDFVVVCIGGANRDPVVYPRPNSFDLERIDPEEHLAFAGGIHYCVGAPLARMEGVIAFRTLAERFPDLAQAGPIERRPSSLIRGLLSFPVRAGEPIGRRTSTPRLVGA